MHKNKTLVVTATNDKLFKDYAHRFLEGFPHKHLDLVVYAETYLDIPHKAITDKDFAQRNAHRPVTSYKYDAVRFHWKVNAIQTLINRDAQSLKDYTSILWLDSDIVFLKDIDQTWINKHLHTNDIMSYMGRPNYYSEMGIIYFNLEHEHTIEYINEVWEYYTSDEVYNLQEQHDSYVWDYVRIKREFENNWKFRNLGVDYKVPGGHIAIHLYGDYMDHCKGKRKVAGYSAENTQNNRKN